jgi:AcrR family transcriptional regulator
MVQTTTPTGRHAERRLEILRRAAEVFRAKGYHRAGMREIARGLGLAPGALYHYFESKDDLLYACQDLSLTRLLEGAKRIAAGDEEAAAKVRRLARLHLRQTLVVTGGSAAHLELDALPPSLRGALVARRDAYEREVRGVLEAGMAAGDFRPLPAKLATLAFLGALNWSVVWWRPGGGWGVDDVADAIADLHLRGWERGLDRETSA